MTRHQVCLHLFGLSAFAIAQPLFDLLGRNPEFFTARNAAPGEVLILAIILVIAVPLVLMLTVWTVGSLNRTAGVWAYCALVAILLSLIALPMIKRLDSAPGLLLCLIALIVGILGCVLYTRVAVVSRFVTVLAIGVLVFPGIFLLREEISKVLWSDGGTAPQFTDVHIPKPAPIVFVVLDELPVTSLMDSKKQIDHIRYPNFARLANDSIWFRGATTVAAGTLESLPAIVGGRLPTSARRLATAEEYPETLFTLLSGTYELHVFESITSLCPQSICPRQSEGPIASLYGLMFDVALIYPHIVLPPSISSGLPDVTHQWGNFRIIATGAEAKSKNTMNWLQEVVRPWQKEDKNPSHFREFIETVHYSPTPALYYLHVLLPHVPFQYLPSGKKYPKDVWASAPDYALKNQDWEHEWVAAQYFQRSLLQLAYVDRLLGELLDKLHSQDMYRDSLIILVSDHGANYTVGKHRRALSADNYMDLLPVVLMIKQPGESTGVVSDRNVETIDILPTIADVLDFELPWAVDGQSMLSGSLPERAYKQAYSKEHSSVIRYPASIDEKYDTLKYKQSLLGAGADPIVLYGMGLRSDLIGRTLADCAYRQDTGFAIEIDDLEAYQRIDLAEDYLPARITGRVGAPIGEIESFDLAVSLSGTIVAVGRTYMMEGSHEFSIIAPENAFRSGDNDLVVFVPGAGCAAGAAAQTVESGTTE